MDQLIIILFWVMVFLQTCTMILLAIVFDATKALKKTILHELAEVEDRLKSKINAFLIVFKRAKNKE
ncbi:MAG: hypothetical protein ACXVJE_19380 [Mucilaginibacter sp.]